MARLRLLGALLVAALVAVSGSASGAVPKPLFPVTVRAANGPVTLEKRPQRIVSLSPTATETLFAVGAGSQVIAVDALSNYPARAPRTELSGYRPNVESIVSYRPDLVVIRSDGGVVAKLKELGIPVLLDPEAASLPDAYRQIRQLGHATGFPRKAEALVVSIRRQISATVKSVQGRARGLSHYHELTTDYYSATSKTFIGQIYRLFGLRNIADAAASAGVAYPKLSAEYIVSADPDLIFLADAKCCGQGQASVAARPGWSTLKAVARRQVVALDDDIVSRWGPRVVLFVKQVASAVRKARP
jgi:iron complex transport system substrate-binding protein